jgi:hypothetical protein
MKESSKKDLWMEKESDITLTEIFTKVAGQMTSNMEKVGFTRPRREPGKIAPLVKARYRNTGRSQALE